MGGDKQAKKAAKAQAKQAKQAVKAATQAAASGASAGAPHAPLLPAAGPTPAERSATAAEQAVAINRHRYRVQIIAAVLTLVALLLTLWAQLKPGDPDKTPSSQPAANRSQ